MVLALYIHSPEVEVKRAPELLWPQCLIMLYWRRTVWLKTSRGEMHDPIIFARRSISLAAGGDGGAVAGAALLNLQDVL